MPSVSRAGEKRARTLADVMLARGTCVSRSNPSVNPAFVPIELKVGDEGSVAVAAELEEVIGSEPPA